MGLIHCLGVNMSLIKLFLFSMTITLVVHLQVEANIRVTKDKVIDVFEFDDSEKTTKCKFSSSYALERRRFYAMIDRRCGVTKELTNPALFEPSFVFINPNSLDQVAATASPKDILKAGFDPKKKTLILIHGYTQTVSEESSPWIFKARDQHLKNSLNEHYNLIAMDWTKAAGTGGYFDTTKRINTMGSFLANFTMRLTDELGSDRMDIHLIGYSLGAHVAGFAGKRINNPKLGHITGIDPAGPCYGKIFDSAENEQLSANDAYLVDILHADNSLFGKHAIQGQFDVYFNGGALQPNCGDNLSNLFDGFITILTQRNKSISASHTRSVEIAVEGLWESACQHVAYECPTYTGFKNGECGECDEQNTQCYFMGFPFQFQHPMPNSNVPLRTTNGVRGKRYFALTGPEGHLCLQHTQLVINLIPLGPNSKYERKNYSFQVELESTSQARAQVLVKNKKSAGVYTHLLLSEGRPDQIYRAKVQIKDHRKRIIPIAQLPSPVLDIRINFMSRHDYKERQALSSKLCPTSVVDDNWIEFSLCS